VSIGTAWYLDVNHFARDTPWAHGFLAAYALWAGLVVLSLLLIAAWLVVRHRVDAPRAVATAFLAGLGTVIALLLNQHVISPAVARPRPCHALHHVEVLLACNNDFSFPSDHCMLAGAFAAGLLLVSLRFGIPAVLLALLLAFSRVYTGVHYPGDAAAGLLIGAAICTVTVLLLRRPATALARRLARTPLRPLFVAGDKGGGRPVGLS
jgi:undecaprenyl-diphosphatase